MGKRQFGFSGKFEMCNRARTGTAATLEGLRADIMEKEHRRGSSMSFLFYVCSTKIAVHWAHHGPMKKDFSLPLPVVAHT